MSEAAELPDLLAEQLADITDDPAKRLPAEVVDLLHCLGFVYLRHGQAQRAVVLLMLASRAAPDRPDVLRTLAAAMIGAGLGVQAEGILDRLATVDPGAARHRMVSLMRARALLLQDRVGEAQALFRAEVAPSGDALSLAF